MPLDARKRVKHLARYFGVLAVFCFVGYKVTNALFFLFFLGPPFFLVYWLRTQAGLITEWLPNTPLFNNLFLFFPITVIYFGLVGFQTKNFLNERGLLRVLELAVLIVFLTYIHTLSFQEIALYWEGSTGH